MPAGTRESGAEASLYDVIRTQVQPVSLQTRRSHARQPRPGCSRRIQLPVADHQFTVKQMQLQRHHGGAADTRFPARGVLNMLTSSVLYQSQAAGRRSQAPPLSILVPTIAEARPTPAPPPVSAAIRRARRSHSGTGGRSTSIGQATKDSTTGRSVSISCRHSAHPAICAPTRTASLEGRGLQGVQEHPLRMVLTVPVRRPTHGSFTVFASAWRSLISPERMRVLTVPSG